MSDRNCDSRPFCDDRREALSDAEDRIESLEALLHGFWNTAAESGLLLEMEKRRAFRELDKGMRELGLLPKVG